MSRTRAWLMKALGVRLAAAMVPVGATVVFLTAMSSSGAVENGRSAVGPDTRLPPTPAAPTSVVSSSMRAQGTGKADDRSAVATPGAVSPAAVSSQAVVLKSEWGPTIRRRVTGAQPALNTLLIGHESDPGFGTSNQGPTIMRAPPAGFRLAPPGRGIPLTFTELTMSLSGVDPMVAVGRQFMIHSQDHWLVFLDRSGNALPSKNGIGSTHHVADIFGDLADGSLGPLDLNAYTGFPKPCHDQSYPETDSGQRYCVVDLYDLRAYFDAGADRFILLAQARNRLWTDLWTNQKSYSDNTGVCGVYAPAQGDNLPVPDASHCTLAHRHAVFAVSKTDDPRDGFHTYAIIENNYQDFPWASVNAEGNMLVIGHKGSYMKQGMSAIVFRLSDLREGKPNPAYFKLYASDTGGYGDPSPVVMHGAGATLGGLSLLAAKTGGPNYSRLDVFGFTAPTGQGTKPVVRAGSIVVPGIPVTHRELRNAVYRNGMLHVAWELSIPDDAPVRIRAMRVPIALGAQSIVLSTAPGAGFREAWIGGNEATAAWVDDQDPSIAVNANGDVVIAFSRASGEQVLFVRWPASATQPHPETIVRSRSNPDYASRKTDYSWAVVDPVDDRTVWFAHNAKTSSGTHQGILVRVRP